LKITKFITGVGGVAINENRWKLSNPTNNTIEKKTYQFDGFIYQEGLRNVMQIFKSYNQI
jgi:hypothetical protein